MLHTLANKFSLCSKFITPYNFQKNGAEGPLRISNSAMIFQGTAQRIISVNYMFGKPLIPYDFLKGIFTSNFCDMGNLRPSVFGLKTCRFGYRKRSAKIFGKEITPTVFRNEQKCPSNFEKTQVPLE